VGNRRSSLPPPLVAVELSHVFRSTAVGLGAARRAGGLERWALGRLKLHPSVALSALTLSCNSAPCRMVRQMAGSDADCIPPVISITRCSASLAQGQDNQLMQARLVGSRARLLRLA
jgi:hypothetical protein